MFPTDKPLWEAEDFIAAEAEIARLGRAMTISSVGIILSFTAVICFIIRLIWSTKPWTGPLFTIGWTLYIPMLLLFFTKDWISRHWKWIPEWPFDKDKPNA